jgi:hypothetical protein
MNMGYTIEYLGSFKLDKPLSEEHAKFLHDFAGSYDLRKQKALELLKDVNPIMPAYYCQWIPTEDNMGIKWDGFEKFYNAFDWLKFIIKYYLEPWGYTLNGIVEIRDGANEYPFENGVLEVRDNDVTWDSDELWEPFDEDEYFGFADEYGDNI